MSPNYHGAGSLLQPLTPECEFHSRTGYGWINDSLVPPQMVATGVSGGYVRVGDGMIELALV
jgi:hypothetical protein